MALFAAGALVLLVLTGCSPSSPIVELDATTAPPGEMDPQVDNFVTLMAELYAHFLVRDLDVEDPTIISQDASVAVAVQELDDALSLDSQARDFAAATAFELSRLAGATSTAGDATGVTFDLRDAGVVGRYGARTIAAVTLRQRTTYESGPIIEESITYAVGWHDGSLSLVEPYLQDGAHRGLDSGVGLGSAIGAAERFLQLTGDGDWAAIRTLSNGANAYETDLAVFQSVLEASGPATLVQLPQFASGSTRLVYVLNSAGLVIGRFEVSLAGDTTVVYFPTA